jgi:hypothetical protein
MRVRAGTTQRKWEKGLDMTHASMLEMKHRRAANVPRNCQWNGCLGNPACKEKGSWLAKSESRSAKTGQGPVNSLAITRCVKVIQMNCEPSARFHNFIPISAAGQKAIKLTEFKRRQSLGTELLTASDATIPAPLRRHKS